MARDRGARQRHRHRAPRCCRASSSMFDAGERREPARQGGLGIGLTLVRSLVEMHGGTRRRAQRRARARAASSPCACRSRRAAGAAARRGTAPATASRHARASWSSTTTATPPTASACCSSVLGAEVRVAHDGADGARGVRATSTRASSCSTSACRAWTATRWRAASARKPRTAPDHRRPDRLGPGRRPPRGARGGLRPPPGQAGGHRRAAGTAEVDSGLRLPTEALGSDVVVSPPRRRGRPLRRFSEFPHLGAWSGLRLSRFPIRNKFIASRLRAC